MSNLETYRAKAAAWLETMVPIFGKDARRGLSEADDLALARRYQNAKYEAGYAGSTGRSTMAAKVLAISKK